MILEISRVAAVDVTPPLDDFFEHLVRSKPPNCASHWMLTEFNYNTFAIPLILVHTHV